MINCFKFICRPPWKDYSYPICTFPMDMQHCQVMAMLFPYYFPRKLHKITHLCTRCFPCTLTNYATCKHILGSFPIPQYMFEVTVADLMESLPPSTGSSHILILCCSLTNFLICYPLKDKTAKHIASHFQYGLLQFF